MRRTYGNYATGSSTVDWGAGGSVGAPRKVATDGLGRAAPEAVAFNAAGALSVYDFEPAYRQRVSSGTIDYLYGAAADEITLRWNRESLDRLRLRLRAMVDVTRLDTRVTLFGQQMAHPILLAPTGGHRSSHPEGELATAKGAGAAGATMVVSTMASTAVEDIAKVATQPLWFQLYILRDRGFTRALVQRAEDAGCRALCVTVDTATTGPRNREMRGARTRSATEGPVERPHLKGLRGVRDTDEPEIFSAQRAPNVTWKDIAWLRSFARVPVLLKGIVDGADAARAVQEGVAGIIVSNHGARNLDTGPATIDALPEVVEKAAGRVPVLMDSGIRRGTDVVKALALGAKAVLIGRPYIWGLGAAGAEGVTRVVNILRTELEMAMASTGQTSVARIERSVLWDAR